MASPVLPFISKLLRKLVMAALVALMAYAAYSLWLFGKDRADYAEHRAHLIATLETGRATVQGELDTLTKRHEELTLALAAQQTRGATIEKNIATLHELDPGVWDQLFGDSDQIKTHEARLARLETLKLETAKQVEELQKQLVADDLEKSTLGARLVALNAEHATVLAEKRPGEHYLRLAWEQGHLAFYAVFLVYLFGGVLVAFVLYYGWATLVSRGQPLRLAATAPTLPAIGDSTITVEDALWPGEVAWVRKGFLHASDEALTRRRRWLLSWRRPFSCVAAGLTRLAELRNVRIDGERRLVFANARDPFAEFAVVTVPEGGALVLRAGFLIAVIAPSDRLPRVRRSWRFFHWQSWVSGQFGYFQLSGPCRLVVSGVRALQAEQLTPTDDGREATSRAQQAGIVGFTPTLGLKPVRTGGFWRYCRTPIPLFDAQFSGSGVFVTRESALRTGAGKSRGRDGWWHRGLKLFGI